MKDGEGGGEEGGGKTHGTGRSTEGERENEECSTSQLFFIVQPNSNKKMPTKRVVVKGWDGRGV